MLTTAIDSLIGQLSYARYPEPDVSRAQVFDTFASEFQPMVSSSLPVDPAPLVENNGVVQVKVQTSQHASTKSVEIVQVPTCLGCWEVLPQVCFCEATHLCIQCTGYFGQADVSTKPFWDALALFEGGTIQTVEFYDTCRTMVASTVNDHHVLTVTVPPAALSVVLAKARAHNVHIVSHLSKQYRHSARTRSIAPQALEEVAEQTPEAVEEVTEEDRPQYAAEHMHKLILQAVEMVTRQLSESPSWHLPADSKAGIVALRRTYVLGDGKLYSKSDARELIGTVGRLCGDEENLFGR